MPRYPEHKSKHHLCGKGIPTLEKCKNFIDEYHDKTPNKLYCLVKNVSATIYKLIFDYTIYESAFNTLDKYFMKKKYNLTHAIF